MSEGADDTGAGVRFPPPLIFLGFLLLGPLIDRLLRLPSWPMPWWIGAVIVLAGAALIGAAVGVFRRGGEDPRPWTATGQLLATGIYRWSRNPMYLGMALVALGLAVAIGSAMGVMLAPVAMAVVGSTVIDREEAYLSATFGDGYRAYHDRVRRWF